MLSPPDGGGNNGRSGTRPGIGVQGSNRTSIRAAGENIGETTDLAIREVNRRSSSRLVPKLPNRNPARNPSDLRQFPPESAPREPCPTDVKVVATQDLAADAPMPRSLRHKSVCRWGHMLNLELFCERRRPRTATTLKRRTKTERTASAPWEPGNARHTKRESAKRRRASACMPPLQPLGQRTARDRSFGPAPWTLEVPLRSKSPLHKPGPVVFVRAVPHGEHGQPTTGHKLAGKQPPKTKPPV